MIGHAHNHNLQNTMNDFKQEVLAEDAETVSTSIDINAVANCDDCDIQSAINYATDRDLLHLSASVAKFITAAIISDTSYADKFANKDCLAIFHTASSVLSENKKIANLPVLKAIFSFSVSLYEKHGYISTDDLNELASQQFAKQSDRDVFSDELNKLSTYYTKASQSEKECKIKDFYAVYDVCQLIMQLTNNKLLCDKFGRFTVTPDNIAKIKSELRQQSERMAYTANRMFSFTELDAEFYNTDITRFRPIDRLATGVDSLDKFLKGGIGRGEVTMLVAPSGIGKTQWAIATSDYMCRRHLNVLHIDLEMKTEQVMGRYLSRIAGVSLNDLDIIAQIQPSLWDQYVREFMAYRNNRKVVSLQNNDISATTILNEVRMLIKNGWTPDCIIVDYFDKLAKEDGDDGNVNVHETDGHTFHVLERLANETNAAVLTFSQTKKEGVNRKKTDAVSADAVSGSAKKIEMSALALMFDCIDEKYVVNVLKNRNGQRGNVDVEVDNTCSRIFSAGQSTAVDYVDREDARTRLLADISDWKYRKAKEKDSDNLLISAEEVNDGMPF